MALDLLAHGLAVRISQEENTSFLQREAMDTKHQLPQLETYSKVDQKIKEALDWDLNDSPGLIRVTMETIVIHKRRQANEKESSIMANT